MSSLSIVLPLLVVFCWGTQAAPDGKAEGQVGQEQLQKELVKDLDSLDPALKTQLEYVFSHVKVDKLTDTAINMIDQQNKLSAQDKEQVKTSMLEVIADFNKKQLERKEHEQHEQQQQQQ